MWNYLPHDCVPVLESVEGLASPVPGDGGFVLGTETELAFFLSKARNPAQIPHTSLSFSTDMQLSQPGSSQKRHSPILQGFSVPQPPQ